MFFGSSERFTRIAKQIINEVKKTGTHPNELLVKYSHAEGLNTSMQQRVVEEYNVHMFLDNLKEGNQTEEYIIMNPVVDEAASYANKILKEYEGTKKLGKTASYNIDTIHIPSDAFEYETNIENFQTQQVQSSLASEFFDEESLYKEAEAREDRVNEQELEYLTKTAEVNINEQLNNITKQLIKVANISPGVAKGVVYDLVKEGQDDLAESVLIYCNHKPHEIASSVLGEGAYEVDLPYLDKTAELIKEAGMGRFIIKSIKKIKVGNYKPKVKKDMVSGFFDTITKDPKTQKYSIIRVLNHLLSAHNGSKFFRQNKEHGTRQDIGNWIKEIE